MGDSSNTRARMKLWLMASAIFVLLVVSISLSAWCVWQERFSGNQLTSAFHSEPPEFDSIMRLLSLGADTEAEDEQGCKPIHLAFWVFHMESESTRHDPAADIQAQEVVRALIDSGADVNSKDKTGITPLHLAANMGFDEIADELVGAGAKVNAQDYRGRTPLHWAIWFVRPEVVGLLIRAGADVNAADFNGQTPLDWTDPDGGWEEVNLRQSWGWFDRGKIEELKMIRVMIEEKGAKSSVTASPTVPTPR